MRYSNIQSGGSRRPLDAAVGFAAPISGPDGGARTSRAFLQLTIMPRLWGRDPAAVAPIPVSGDGVGPDLPE